jgi:hypothetical protein
MHPTVGRALTQDRPAGVCHQAERTALARAARGHTFRRT